jgi:hypothetical protein
MVAGMIFLGLTAYIIFGRRPKQLRRQYCRCLGGKDEVEEEETSMKQVSVTLETSSTASYTPEGKPSLSQPSDSIPETRGDMDVRSKSHRKRSSRSRSRTKNRKNGGGRHVGESVGHVAKDAKDVDGQPGNLMKEWEAERKGIRYEVGLVG